MLSGTDNDVYWAVVQSVNLEDPATQSGVCITQLRSHYTVIRKFCDAYHTMKIPTSSVYENAKQHSGKN